MSKVILAENNPTTMLSYDLLSLINAEREKFNENPVRLNQFNSRVTDELEGDYYKTFVVENPNKTTSNVYELTIDQCMLVSMRESKSVRRSVLAMLNKAKPQHQIPQTLSQALLLASQQAEQIEVQKEQLATAAPKVEYFEKVLETKNGFTATEIASELKMSAIKLNRSLREMNVQRKIGSRWVLTAGNLDQGLSVERTHVDDGGKSRHSMLWTEKGRMFILGLFNEVTYPLV
ncbi:MAG: DNA-binding protein [Alteromonas sp.]|nr:DNA-binding protein [Alteromonas sp.]